MDPPAATLPHPRGTLHLVGTVPGLASEGPRVGNRFDALQPAAVGLGVGPEDLHGLRAFLTGTTFEPVGSDADDVYEAYLRQFGDVALPPPDYVTAVQRATEAGISLVPLDLPEVAYVERFTEEISGWALLRYNRRIQQLAKRPPIADDAVSFHLWWDAQMRRLGGFEAVERAREEAMTARLRSESWPAGDVLVVLEAARLAGVVEAWNAAEGAGPGAPPGGQPAMLPRRSERGRLSALLHKRLK